MSDSEFAERLWRVGRKVGRTVYAMVGDEPSSEDVLIGVMDSSELAVAAVSAHNLKMMLGGLKVHGYGEQ